MRGSDRRFGLLADVSSFQACLHRLLLRSCFLLSILSINVSSFWFGQLWRMLTCDTKQVVILIGFTPARVVYKANCNTKQLPRGELRMPQPNAGLSMGAASCAAALLAAAVPADIVHTSPHAMPSSFSNASSQLQQDDRVKTAVLGCSGRAHENQQHSMQQAARHKAAACQPGCVLVQQCCGARAQLHLFSLQNSAWHACAW